jgi:4-hydroxy-tetrahydrodipicolinate reductase
MEPIKVMVNGLPGNVAANLFYHLHADERFVLIPCSLTGPQITEPEMTIEGISIQLVLPDTRNQVIKEIIKNEGNFICVDFTHPSAVNANAEFYVAHHLPFVMGTTGGDRRRLLETVQASDIAAVIAPNMAKQIVALQAMMEYAADNFPGVFEGYTLDVRESHQSGKADTSGTAKAMVGYFNQMGISFSADQIQKERNPEIQKNEWGIPENHIGGHAWHTYTLTSKDESALFQIKHNINGRDIYAAGTMDALIYLQQKIAEGALGKVFTMIDLLKGV